MTRPGSEARRPLAPYRRKGAKDAGFTLTEILVAVGIFMMFSTAVLTSVLSVSNAMDSTRELTNMNEQARIAIERITRELRQAEEIRAVAIPADPNTDPVELTFAVDFNGNNVIDVSSAEPEVLTYRHDPTVGQLTLTANDENGNAITRPILSEEVTRFVLEYRSSLWQYDANANGITDWTELDAAAGVGNGNGVLDAPELEKIDAVAITLTVMDGARQQTYQTQVGLRNRSQS